MLLDDIIDTAVDSSQRLSVLLRKCLLLAHELKDERLKSWANQELNGYSSKDNIPEYRVVYAGAHGNFSGAFGSSLQDWPIPPVALEEKHREFAEKVYLAQAVSAYEDVVAQESGRIVFEWPGNMVVYYQGKFFDRRYALISAWQEVPKSCLVELLDTIRNRTLNMALEIKEQLGASARDLRNVRPSDIKKVQQTVVNNIYGGTNYFASGQSQMVASTATTQTFIPAGNRQELEAVLLKSGLTANDLQKLTEAEEAEGGQKLGVRVRAWVKDTAPKVVAGGVKIGISVARQLLTEWLKQYYGLN
jgi:hypothetical protein